MLCETLFLYVLSLLLAFSLTFAVYARNTQPLEPADFPGVNTLPDISMEANRDTLSPTGLTVVVVNRSESDISFGARFWLDTLIDGQWYKVPYGDQGTDEIAWDDWGQYARAGVSTTLEPMEWSRLYGSLPPGEYRLVKNGHMGSGSNTATYYFAAAFTLGEEAPAGLVAPQTESAALPDASTQENRNPGTGR